MSWDYTYDIFHVKPDPYTSKWFMTSLYPLIFITCVYLYFVFIAGPRYMKNRSPYKLKSFLLAYNMIQILANAWIVKEHLRVGWLTKYSLKCSEINFDTSDTEVILDVAWWLLQLKMFDYIETCMYVLRKKQEQVSVLHVYHHVTVVMLVWWFLKYGPDPKCSFPLFINCFVHIIMYTYYLCAACGPKIQRIVVPIKSYLTTIQMVQFIVLIILGSQILLPDCKLKKGSEMYPYFIVNLLINLLLFYKFYKKSYTKTSKQKNS